MADILVFVPGLLGSELYDGENKVWPGSGWDAVRGFSRDEFACLLKLDLEPRSIVRTAVGGIVSVYEDWLRYFRGMRRQADNSPMFSEDAGTLITVPYDWRKPCELASERLASIVETVVANHGVGANIHIVAHSLGGLVARHYLQNEAFVGRRGFSQVKTFVTFGAPHNGAPIALAGALGLHKTTFLSTDQSKTLANDPRFTSLYQTFPRPNYPLIWERKSSGHLLPRTLQDRDFATKVLKLTDTGYDSYLNFRASIDDKNYPKGLRRFVLIGTRYETMTHFYWTGGELIAASTQDAGDGTVSIPAALLADAQCQFTGESHVNLIRAVESKNVFAELMDATSLLGPSQVEISVRDISVELNAPVHVSIATDGSLTQVTGALIVEGAPLPADTSQPVPEDLQFAPLRGRAPQPFSYNGPAIQGASIRLPGIGTPGLYRIVVQTSPSVEPIATSPVFAVSAR